MPLKNRAYEAFHIAKYMKSTKRGDFGSVTLSVDFEMVKDEATNRSELEGLSALLEFSRKFSVPITFAVVGKIIEKDRRFVDMILDANARNDIGSHTYSHQFFNEIDADEAEHEIARSVSVLNDAGIRPVSFVFPRNIARHIDILHMYRFRCFRSFHREKHSLSFPTKTEGLWDMPQSIFVSSERSPRVLVSMASMANRKKLNFHMWCHPYNWGSNPKKDVERVLGPVAEYCNKNSLGFKTMKEVADACENQTKLSEYTSNAA